MHKNPFRSFGFIWVFLIIIFLNQKVEESNTILLINKRKPYT